MYSGLLEMATYEITSSNQNFQPKNIQLSGQCYKLETGHPVELCIVQACLLWHVEAGVQQF